METSPRQIVAFGGGGFSMESDNPLLDDYVLGLCSSERPRVCFLPSASGDADHYVVRFYRAFPAERCLSAGSLCWFADAVSGFHGAPRAVEGLGLLPFSNCVHYEPGAERGRAYRRLLREGLRSGYAAEDGAALHFVGKELSRVVASRPAARGYHLDAGGVEVTETRLATTYLGGG